MTKFLHQNVLLEIQSVKITGILSHAFWVSKNFVKATVLLNKLLKSWFDKIFFFVSEGEFLVSHWDIGTNFCTFSALFLHYFVKSSYPVRFISNWKSWLHGIFVRYLDSISVFSQFTYIVQWYKNYQVC